MRQEFRPDYRLIFAFLLAAVIVLSGCTPKQSAAENTMKLGDWIQHIYEEAGLAESDQTAPRVLWTGVSLILRMALIPMKP